MRDIGHIEVGSPLGGGVGIHGGVVSVGAHLGKIGVSGNQRLHHRTNGGRATESVGGVDDTEHSLGTMIGNGAVEECGIGIVDDLLEYEVFQLKTGGKGRIRSRVAGSELRALGDGVVISTPDELDGITDGSIDGEGNITKDTLGRSNIDDVSLAGLGWRVIVRRHRRGVHGLTLLDAIVVGVAVASPAVTSRTVGGGRVGLIHGGGCTVWRRGAGVGVRRGIGVVVAAIRIVVITVWIVVTTVAHAVSGERGRRAPSARRRHLICGPRICGPRVAAGSMIHATAVPAAFDQNGGGRAIGDSMLTSCQCWTCRWVLGDPREAAPQGPWTNKERGDSGRYGNGPSSRFERMESERLWLKRNVCVEQANEQYFLSEGSLATDSIEEGDLGNVLTLREDWTR